MKNHGKENDRRGTETECSRDPEAGAGQKCGELGRQDGEQLDALAQNPRLGGEDSGPDKADDSASGGTERIEKEIAARIEEDEEELHRLIGEVASKRRLFTAAEMKAYAEHRCRMGIESMMREQFLRDLDDVKKIDMAELYSRPENEPLFGRQSVWK